MAFPQYHNQQLNLQDHPRQSIHHYHHHFHQESNLHTLVALPTPHRDTTTPHPQYP
jgi:hypothetical protein